jgi:hypothetical protein
MPCENNEERQKETDERGYGRKLGEYFRHLWKEFTVTGVSVIVTGQRLGARDGAPVEVVYSITVDSVKTIPPGQGGSLRGEKNKDNRFTFVQIGHSVLTNSYTLFLAGRYTGSDPPTEPPS